MSRPRGISRKKEHEKMKTNQKKAADAIVASIGAPGADVALAGIGSKNRAGMSDGLCSRHLY
jgi:hypothetical protein